MRLHPRGFTALGKELVANDVVAIECEPLADLMTNFVLCSRNGGQPLCERAAAPEAVNQ